MYAQAPLPIRERRFYTPKEVAQELSTSVDTVWRMMRRGTLGYVEISSKTRRIPREALDSLVRKGLQRGKTPWES
jgi:excisionase family DNA binding protein